MGWAMTDINAKRTKLMQSSGLAYSARARKQFENNLMMPVFSTKLEGIYKVTLQPRKLSKGTRV